jgi:uncharacterized protein
VDRVFLDANVLFSAAYRARSGLQKLWRVEGATLLTSDYATQEAHRNLDTQAQRRRLDKLVADMEIVRDVPIDAPLPRGIALPEKDRPILAAAIHARAMHLLTGDVTHFGVYSGVTASGVAILLPADYLKGKLIE